MSNAGRPTSYKPEYDDVVVEIGKAGGSVVKMANACGVSKQSLYEWSGVHPEFSDAFTYARQLSQEWWEDLGQKNMLVAPGVGTFSQSAWSRSMAARFPEDWREKKDLNHGGQEDNPIKTEWILEAVDATSPDAS